MGSNKKQKMIDIEQQIKCRMNVTLGITALISDDAKKLFQKFYIREKCQLQTLINRILSTHNEILMERKESKLEIDDCHQNKNMDALQRQYSISYSNFNQRFSIYSSAKNDKSKKIKASNYLQQLVENKNNKI